MGFLYDLYLRIALSKIRFHPRTLKVMQFFSYSDREKLLFDIMDFVRSNKVEGDYLEFGVFEGKTLIPACHIGSIVNRKNKMRFIGFDSFEGLPKPKGVDEKGFNHFLEGNYSYSYERLMENIKKSGANTKRIKIVKGWFKDTLNEKNQRELSLDKAAVIYIDSDLYESAVQVLKFVKRFIHNGTILIFDDWFCYRGDPERGEQKAFSEWLKKNKDIKAIEWKRFGWYGNSFIMRKERD